MTEEARKLADQHGGVWGAHPQFPPCDWQIEVENDDTRLGYWDWVMVQLSADDDERIEQKRPGSND